MKGPIFDTHAHYCSTRFDPDREELLARLPEEGRGGGVRVRHPLRRCRPGGGAGTQVPLCVGRGGHSPGEPD